jgi:hypothetical protein
MYFWWNIQKQHNRWIFQHSSLQITERSSSKKNLRQISRRSFKKTLGDALSDSITQFLK